MPRLACMNKLPENLPLDVRRRYTETLVRIAVKAVSDGKRRIAGEALKGLDEAKVAEKLVSYLLLEDQEDGVYERAKNLLGALLDDVALTPHAKSIIQAPERRGRGRATRGLPAVRVVWRGVFLARVLATAMRIRQPVGHA